MVRANNGWLVFDAIVQYWKAQYAPHAAQQTLLQVFETLVQNGATVLVIEHDLDVMRNADYIIDMGPGGGEAGGRIVAVGTPEQIRENAESVTGQYL